MNSDYQIIIGVFIAGSASLVGYVFYLKRSLRRQNELWESLKKIAVLRNDPDRSASDAFNEARSCTVADGEDNKSMYPMVKSDFAFRGFETADPHNVHHAPWVHEDTTRI